MHRPAPSARPFQALRAAPRTHGLGDGRGPGIGAKVLAGVIAFLALMWVVAVYTPIAHPRDIEVDGATGLSAERIRAALETEASGQSTFNVSQEALMAAVERYPEVAEVKVDARPPFRLDLVVVMRPPVGRAQIGGRSFTVAGDGTVLSRANEAAVPKLDPSLGQLLMNGGRLTGDGGALRVLAAAPDTLIELVRVLRRGEAGLELELSRGPRLIFGNAEDAADKWAAATAVIADGAATRATYIDVRVPGRPAVGGIGGSKNATDADAPPTLTPQAGATAETVTPAASGAAATGAGTATAETYASPSTGTGTAAGTAGGATATGAGTGATTGGSTTGATAPTADTAPAPETQQTAPSAGTAVDPTASQGTAGATGGSTTGGISP